MAKWNVSGYRILVAHGGEDEGGFLNGALSGSDDVDVGCTKPVKENKKEDRFKTHRAEADWLKQGRQEDDWTSVDSIKFDRKGKE